MPWTGFAGALTGSLLSGAAGIGGSIMQANAASAATKQQYYLTKKLQEASDKRSFEYSKALFDFQQRNAIPLQYNAAKQAGINPVLYTGGSGGASGSMPSAGGSGGGVGQADTSAYGNAIRSIADAVQFYLNAQSQQSQIGLNNANADAVREKTRQDELLKDAQAQYLRQKTVTESHLPPRIQKQLDLMEAQIQLSQGRLEQMKNQNLVNAERVKELQSLQEYRRKILEIMGKKDYIGFGNYLRLNFNLGNVVKALENAFSGVGTRTGVYYQAVPDHE